MQVLHVKSGSTASLAKFRMNVKRLAISNGLPDYRIAWDEVGDLVTFYAHGSKGAMAQISDILACTKHRVKKKNSVVLHFELFGDWPR
ncbi:hypothetical protein AU476_40795 [Cupriavidus sp. UYMSc13B]|nr:hypothetical protein AU476_40795 [Cupriavidus sp. UYMSc13B]